APGSPPTMRRWLGGGRVLLSMFMLCRRFAIAIEARAQGSPNPFGLGNLLALCGCRNALQITRADRARKPHCEPRKLVRHVLVPSRETNSIHRFSYNCIVIGT